MSVLPAFPLMIVNLCRPQPYHHAWRTVHPLYLSVWWWGGVKNRWLLGLVCSLLERWTAVPALVLPENNSQRCQTATRILLDPNLHITFGLKHVLVLASNTHSDILSLFENVAHMDRNINPQFNNQQAFLSGNCVAQRGFFLEYSNLLLM